jgi:hypothetical protein
VCARDANGHGMIEKIYRCKTNAGCFLGPIGTEKEGLLIKTICLAILCFAHSHS